ncbi:MAG: hypothetical protein EOP52_10655 [Sphingobacteriales bacterium]|nr:MAG: hypothetical protein EOP52_10655 [Sphingobacteriales bacterium]
MHRFRNLIGWGGMALCLAACQKESQRSPCLEPKNAALRIHFSQRVDTTIRDSALRSPILSPIAGTGALRYTSPAVDVQLFLSPQADGCRYALLPDSNATIADTLTFGYTRQLRFISDACGYSTNFTLTAATAGNRFIDSIYIRNPVVDNNINSPAHVQIYLRR